jgi:hypothetical protein
MVVHADKVRWLFWARWKMFMRGFARNKASLVGFIIGLIFVLGFAGFAAFGTFMAYRSLSAPANSEVLYLVLTALLLIWIVLPLMEYAGNEGLDLSKLSLFPLTRGEMMLSLLFSSLLDVPTLGLILMIGAVIAGWAVSLPVAILTFVTMLIFYVLLVGVSQLILALFMRTLQSRRFRDLSIIIIAVFSSSCYLIQQFALGGTRVLHFYENLKAGNFSPYLQWLPSGYAARAIQQAALGNWGSSLLFLGLLLVASVVALYLWQLVLERSLTASEVGGSARARQRKQQVRHVTYSPPVATNIWSRLISPQVRAITTKDLKYFWRDPQLKAVLFQSVVYVAIFIIGPLLNPDTSRLGGNDYILFVSPLVVLLFLATLSLNQLGLERQSLTMTFLFPIEPRRLLLGKNLAIFLVGLGELVLLTAVGAFVSHAWEYVLPVVVIGLAGMGIMLGCGNFTSVFFPQYVRPMQRGFRTTGTTSQAGCLRAIMSLLMMVVAALLVAPVFFAIFLPMANHAQWIWAITMPLSLIYGIVFHQIVTRMVAPRILDQAPEILAITTRE